MPEKKGTFTRPKAIRAICMVALYGVILLAAVLIGLEWDRRTARETTETFGSLEGRFISDVSLNYRGRTIYYRENEITNYLLIGMDREKEETADFQDGGQADFLMLLSIDRRNRAITPVMIDRDTMAQVPIYGVFGNPAGTRRMQICLAQAFSGSNVSGGENSKRAVSTLLSGIKIDHYLLLDLEGISLLNDAVGGVTVTLADDLTALDARLKKGETILLEGKLAEHFVRGRTTVADGTNASRMTRQKTYLEALLKTMQEKMRKDGLFLENVFDSISEHMESDTMESVLIHDANAYYQYDWKELILLPGEHRLGEDGFAEFWPDEAAMTETVVNLWFAR